MEDKLNHSLLFDSLPVQKFSLGVGSKGCFTSCPKHVSEMILGGAITKPKQNCKEYTNSSISMLSLAVILQNHRSLWLGGHFSRLSLAVPLPSTGNCILSFLPEGLISGWHNSIHFPHFLGMWMSRIGLLILARISISYVNSIIFCD